MNKDARLDKAFFKRQFLSVATLKENTCPVVDYFSFACALRGLRQLRKWFLQKYATTKGYLLLYKYLYIYYILLNKQTYPQDISLGNWQPFINFIANSASDKGIVQGFSFLATIDEGQHPYLIQVQYKVHLSSNNDEPSV